MSLSRAYREVVGWNIARNRFLLFKRSPRASQPVSNSSFQDLVGKELLLS